MNQLCRILDSLTEEEAADFLERVKEREGSARKPLPKGNPGYVFQYVDQAARALSSWKHAGERRRDTLLALAPLYLHASRWDDKLFQVRQILLDDDNTIEQFTAAVAILQDVLLDCHRLMARNWPENP